MSFLQPALLWALPLIALPVIIHLISRRRHRIVPWAAMMFLLDAQRASQGMARLRQWLILALRVLALTLLIIAAGRPLLSAGANWLGGSIETIFIVLDRSSSMEQIDPQGDKSKRRAALDRMKEYVQRVGRVQRVVLLDSATGKPIVLEDVRSLDRLPQTQATAAAANIPGLLQQIADRVERDKTGGGEIWILSDLRAADWNPSSGRWGDLRRRFGTMPQLAIRLLAFDQPAQRDHSIRVTRAEVETASRGDHRLSIDFTIERLGTDTTPTQIPVTFEIDGVSTSHTVMCREREHVVRGFPIPLDEQVTEGWGVVSIPADDQPGNNRFYFSFAPPIARHTVIVCEDRGVGRYFEQVAATPNERGIEYSAEVVSVEQAATADLDAASLVVWQAPFPTGQLADRLKAFLAEGRPMLVLPPTTTPAAGDWFGLSWSDWKHAEKAREGEAIDNWRTDSGLLAHDESGRPLPVADWRILRWRTLEGNAIVTARLATGDPMLVRAAAPEAAECWFLAALPRAADSNIAQERIVSYVMTHRLIAQGARIASPAKMWDAGSGPARSLESSPRLAPAAQAPVSVPASAVAGVFRQDGHRVALNRPGAEDATDVLDSEQIDRLFEGCNFRSITGGAGEDRSLAREVWRAMLLAMLAALVAEGMLSLPNRPIAAQQASAPGSNDAAPRREAA